jgi:hypothetical protein
VFCVKTVLVISDDQAPAADPEDADVSAPRMKKQRPNEVEGMWFFWVRASPALTVAM